MTFRDEFNDIIQFTSDKAIKDRATAFHPDLGKHVLIDGSVLSSLTENRKPKRVPLNSLITRGKADAGYSKDRQRLADIMRPMIIDSQNNVIDGRHRHMKLTKMGKRKASVIRATAKDIEKAAIIQRL